MQNHHPVQAWKLHPLPPSVAKQDTIDRINQLEYDFEGQNMLAVIGKYRSAKGEGEKAGSVLWAL